MEITNKRVSTFACSLTELLAELLDLIISGMYRVFEKLGPRLEWFIMSPLRGVSEKKIYLQIILILSTPRYSY